ncbi:Muscle M-line assembly protein unc-89 [Labeo rohita]|uniref:Muscle M-line assembly protein unc-89 n=1 Tax=Labeo rohita TaxID=84645 RepID=A0ABQ8LXH2_LABRO|nr:Muscle M-line assembly protein unc-89 [Labeo rohita]
MSHQSIQSVLHKHYLPKTSSDCHCSTAQFSCQTDNAAHTSKPVCSSSMKTDVHFNSSHKVRRLKTRKERNQIRGLERNRYHPSSQHSRREGCEKAHHPLSCSRKVRAFAKPYIPQKPSFMTEGRLTSIRGPFSHEIRSMDIERLVSEQIKRDQQRKEQGKQFVMHVTSPLLPSVPDSDLDCNLDEVQEPLQEAENNMTPQVKRKRSSRKEPSEKNTTNRGVFVSMRPSREDEKRDRNANTRQEDTNSKTRQESQSSPPKETEHVVLASSENEAVPQLCSTPIEPEKNNSQTGNLQSHDEVKKTKKNQQNGFMNIQRFEKNSTRVGVPNMEVTQVLENQQTLTSLSDLDSGAGQVDNVEQGEQMSLSCREAVKRLTTRLCQSSELRLPSRRRPLLTECRETLLQTLQKRHSFHLEHNLHRLQSFLHVNQMASQLSSGQRDESCSSFSHAVENENRSRNMGIWTDSAMQQDYLAQEVKRDLEREAFAKKHRTQDWKSSSTLFSLKEPQQSNTDMFDQWRADSSSQDCFRAQRLHSRQLFNQEQTFTQHAVPVLRSPTWADQPVNFYSQQPSLSRGESWTNVDLDLSRISQQWREDNNLDFSSHRIYESRKQKPQEASVGGSRFWSHQPHIRDERERWPPFSTSYLSEGFQYKPFFRCPHPSAIQHRSDYLGITQCPRTNTPDRVFYPPFYL